MTRVTRLVLIRHTETAQAALGRCYGRTEFALSREGIERATRIGEIFALVALGATYSSPLERARLTAERIVRHHTGEVTIDERLQEIDFGDFEGRRFSEIERDWPDAYAAWMRDPASVRFPNGEDFSDVRRRVGECVHQIVERHRGSTVVVVTHAGALRAMLAHVLLMPDVAAFRLAQHHGAINVVEFCEGAPVLRAMNVLVGTDADVDAIRAALGVHDWGVR